MAERRCLSKKITDTDAFLEMPLSAQALYFHFNMCADDDGFVGSPNMTMRKVGANKNDYDMLLFKNFIIHFESGICVVKHWWMHNTLQKDRYKGTNYIDEKYKLVIKENKAYTLGGNGVQLIDQFSDADEKQIKKHKYGTYKNVLLTEHDYQRLMQEKDGNDAIEFLSEYRERKGYKCKNDNLAIRKWVFCAIEEERQRKAKIKNGGYNVPPKQKMTRHENNPQYSPEYLNSLYANLDEVKVGG